MRRALLLTLLALGACAHPSAEPALSLGSYAIDVSPATASFQLRRRGDVLLRFPADAIQLGTVGKLDDALSYDPFWLEYSDDVLKATPPPDLRFRKVTSMAITAHTASEVTLAYQLEGDASAMLTLRAEADGRFSARLIPSVKSGAVAYLRLRARAGSSEGFYGLGEWADQVNHRGKLRPMQMEADLSNESASNDAHVPVPLLIGTRGWGLFVESRRVGLFDVARKEDDLVEITFGTAEQSADGLAFHLFGAEHPLDITRRYYEVTGFPLLPAPWALGPWIWRDESKDQAEVLDDVKKIRELDLATSAIWIDRPYATAVNTFDFKASQFPDPAAMVGAIHDAGLRLALWHTPYLEKAAEPLASEAKAKGYFPPRPGTALNHWSDPLDLTNPEAYAWWQEHVRRYAALGIEGYKLDYAEDVLPGIAGGRNPWRFADGSDERTMHHGYVTLYHRLYAETLPASGGFLLCRAGRWGDQKNVSVIWPGDMDATFTRRGEPVPDGDKTVIGTGGLPAVLTMALSLGPSGFPFFGADTGGYRHSPPTKELFVRWVEQSALSTVMQVGDSSSQPPWVFTRENGRDQEALEIYRQYARLHLRLFPYLWTHAQRLKQDGRPLMRPLGLAFPELGKHPDDEYLLGDDLLVAPVLTAGATSRKVLFPPGEWTDWWEGTTHTQGEETIAAPLGKLPLFVRAGAIVPLLRPTIDTLSPVADGREKEIDSFVTTAGKLFARITLPAGGRPLNWSSTLHDGTVLQLSGDGNSGAVGIRAGAAYRFGAHLEIVGVDAGARSLFEGPCVESLDFCTEGEVLILELGPNGQQAWSHPKPL